MSSWGGVSCTLTNLIRVPGEQHVNWGCGLVLRVDFASHKCKTAAGVWSLGNAEMKLFVAAKIRFIRALGEGEIDQSGGANTRV